MTDMVGKILHNRYKILRPVGVGGMAEVYLAQDMLLDREVAVKIPVSYTHLTLPTNSLV